MKWTPELLQRAETLFRSGHSYHDVALLLGNGLNEELTAEQVRMALRRYRIAMVADVGAKPSLSVWQVSADKVLVCSDLHVPYHSADMIDRLCKVASREDVTTLCIAGDLFDFDAISAWPSVYPSVSLDEELTAVGIVLETLGDVFSTIYVLMGNHDQRFMRRLQSYMRLEDLIAVARHRAHDYRASSSAKFCATDCQYMDFVFAHTTWRVGHFSKVSRKQGEVARQLANKYRMNVAGGHDHMQGFASSDDGKFMGVSIGCMVDMRNGRSPFWYAESKLHDMPAMQQGFLLLREGVPFLYNESGLACLNGSIPWHVYLS